MITTTHARRTALGTIALTATLLAAGCSSSGSGKASPATRPASAGTGSTTAQGSTTTPITITIKDFGYDVTGPAKPGAKITVTNEDAEAHTVTADAGKAFDATVAGGKTVTFTAPGKAGKYKFHCNFHSNMHGSLTIE